MIFSGAGLLGLTRSPQVLAHRDTILLQKQTSKNEFLYFILVFGDVK